MGTNVTKPSKPSSYRFSPKLSPSSRCGIGVVFTPAKWTSWLVRRNKIVDAWVTGKSVLDPTCGEGEFLFSIVQEGLQRGFDITELPIANLFGIERDGSHLEKFARRFRDQFGIDFPKENLLCCDLLLDNPHVKADLLVGNPPWQNFTDLPDEYKKRIKPLFLRYALVRDSRDLLLGCSRIDIAALIISKAIKDHLETGGSAFFFLPLSLLLNEGAHAGFRRFDINGVKFAVTEFFDFDGVEVFTGVATRYGAAHFKRDADTRFPIPCYTLTNSRWRRSWAGPVFDKSGPMSIVEERSSMKLIVKSKVVLRCDSKPRQGVNTCGANGVLLFSNYRQLDDRLAEIISKDFGAVRLPSRFLYPLLDKANFADPDLAPRRFVLLPYDRVSGKPLNLHDVRQHPELWSYLQRASSFLKSRKGNLIGTWIKRGQWWASLGVGSYCFTSHKVAWLAYGQSKFEPRIFGSYEGRQWQGNQALHAYIPARTRDEAENILRLLSRDEVNLYLQSFKMNGTRSWAQPGKVSRLFDFIPVPKDDGFDLNGIV